MKIMSWNVNGLRACAKKGFENILRDSGADVFGIQELRCSVDQVPKALVNPEGYSTHFNPALRKGYSGTALFSKLAPDSVETSVGNPLFDEEGRVQIARYGNFYLANVYFPNGSGTNDDNSRVPFKLAFYRKLFNELNDLAKDCPVLVMGDMNTAHRAVDLARPKQNEDKSGFLKEEREALDQIFSEGWTDTFRHLHPDEVERYTWWSYKTRARERNVGWRIDYIFLSDKAMPYLKSAEIRDDIEGSDHCPVEVEVDDAIKFS